MKRFFFSMSICTSLIMNIAAQTLPQLGKDPVDKVINAMTLNEKVMLLKGTGMTGMTGGNAAVGETQNLVPGAAGTTTPLPRLGIPAIVLADGPAGLRIQPKRPDDPGTYYCTAFPIGTLLASTWNVEAVEQVGKAMGNEVLEYGVDVLLAPALNIHRNLLCGRNFEYYSEDPLIAGKIAAAYVKGIQSNGVGTSIKHFAGNNQETNRTGNDIRISQRALREIYLKGFEIAVKEAQPWTVMTSYNKINGTYTSESRALVTDILRSEWGFKGTVMTDWFGGKNPPAQMHAGNDLLMPGIPVQANAIEEAVKNGTLSEADVDANVKRVLSLIVNAPHFKKYHYSNKPDLKAHAVVARESAAEGMVLLENNAATLPIKSEVKQVAAYGITSYDWIAGGTGSGDVNRAYTVSLVHGLSNAGYTLDEGIKNTYEKYIATEKEKNKPDQSNPFANFLPKKRILEMVPETTDLATQVAANDIAVITLGRTSGEFFDRKIDEDFQLSDAEHKLVESICAAYHKAAKKVVVVLNIGGVIETASWKELPDAILLAWQTGLEGGNSVADILSGKVTPSGKLPMTFPVNYMDAASSSNFPHDYTPDMKNIMSSMVGNVPEHDPVRNVDYTVYEEDIYVGYRYFDTFGKPVSYPFGYGLSYTSFSFNKASVKEDNGKFTISVTIKNTGKMTGKEVAELYISAPIVDYPAKPGKELKAFAKTRLLQPGEEQILIMDLSLQDLASFNDKMSAWVADAGNYNIQIGPSSQDTRQHLTLKVSSKTTTERVHDVLKPEEKIMVLTKK
jgi:beta-glucosidase